MIYFLAESDFNMSDKTFELMEKLYLEFMDFKVEINKKADKNSILLEKMNDNIQILAEVQQNHLEINERQHDDMNNTNKEQTQLLKNALQHVIHNMD